MYLLVFRSCKRNQKKNERMRKTHASVRILLACADTSTYDAKRKAAKRRADDCDHAARDQCCRSRSIGCHGNNLLAAARTDGVLWEPRPPHHHRGSCWHSYRYRYDRSDRNRFGLGRRREHWPRVIRASGHSRSIQRSMMVLPPVVPYIHRWLGSLTQSEVRKPMAR